MSLASWKFVKPKGAEETTTNSGDQTAPNGEPRWFFELPIKVQRYRTNPKSFTADESVALWKEVNAARFPVVNGLTKFSVQVESGNCKNLRRRDSFIDFLDQTYHPEIDKFFSALDREMQRLLTSAPADPSLVGQCQHSAMISATIHALRQTQSLKHAAYSDIDVEIQKIKDWMLEFASKRALELETEELTNEKMARAWGKVSQRAAAQEQFKAQRANDEAREREAEVERRKNERLRKRQTNAAKAAGLKHSNDNQ